jgi:amylosucrase
VNGKGEHAAPIRVAVLHARLRRYWPAVVAGLTQLYPDDGQQLAKELSDRVTRHVAERPDELFVRDLAREAEPDWFQQPSMVGYVAYTDRFAGTLSGVLDRLDYLDELGITYLHLMPLLQPRDGENDGGYAVASFEHVDRRLGTVDDLRVLARALHERGATLCIDLVVNHTASEHPWAVRARAGDEHFRRYYRFFPDRTVPDRYERTLREVFPTFAPGNFTWLDDAEQWVWTTFNDYQWDLDWSNPDVFCEMFDVMLRLADLGVDALRLDAVPFMWKREGTDCENLPEVHVLLRTLRALLAVAAPATIFKAEAIVPPDQLTPYLGAGDPPQHECELAYHNQLMVLLWSSLATGDAELMSHALRRVVDIPTHASWVTYLRCHDDIGWAITDESAASMGWNGFSHRSFLNSFYSGEFSGSFARGAIFQFNAETGDGRISGSAASLCGIEHALESGDREELDLACRRLEICYAVVASFGGIPLLYMGDELGLLNDASYADDAELAGDNRWLHRPRMDWDVAERRLDASSIEHRLFSMFCSLFADRAATPALHGSATVRVLNMPSPSLFGFVRIHPVAGRFAMVANFGRQRVLADLSQVGLDGWQAARTSGVRVTGTEIAMEPMGYVWLTATA